MRDDDPVVPVESRPLPGWPRHRVGGDSSVWALRARPGRARFGWRWDAAAWEWAPVEAEREALALMRRLEADGVSQGRIAAELGRAGVSTRLGGRWRQSHVLRILRRDPDVPPPPPAWRWERLPVADRAGVATVVLWAEGERRRVRRPVELLHRAAFRPELLTPAERRSLGLEAPAPAAIRAEDLAYLPPPPPPAGAPATTPATTQPEVIEDDDDGDGLARGSRHGSAKLTEDMVREARRLKGEGWTERELAARFGVSRTTMQNLLSGRSWSHVPMAGE